MRRQTLVLVALLATFVACRHAAADAYDPPASYYAGAVGTGSTLKTQLTAAISAGHIQRTYGDFRESAAITDADPNHAGNILLVYDRVSVPATWNGNTWNREHVWPQARQPGADVSNSSRGNLGDPHALRPSTVSVNSDRGNEPFGFDATIGGYQQLSGGTYFFPGDPDKGDIARQLFYSDVRYGASLGLSLVDSTPTGNQMGDLSSLLAWHYLDPPDTFERRRNQAIYSQSMNPSYYTNNRSPFVDRPELAWSVYVDQMNDTQLAIQGGTPAGAGGTTANVDFGRVIVGSTPTQSLTLAKSGSDGTYFSVTAAGSATSTINGRYNTFAIGASQNRSLIAGLTSTSTAGARTGSIVIDNLDVTTLGGAGNGANDANDTVAVTAAVLDHARPSLAATPNVITLNLNLGSVPQGDPDATLDFSLFNVENAIGFTAGLDLDAISGAGATSVLTTNLATFNGASSLPAGSSRLFTATLDSATLGSFTATYTLSFSDENLLGAASRGTMTLSLAGQVVAAPANADFDGDLDIDGADFLTWQRGVGVPDVDHAAGDANNDRAANAADLGIWSQQFASTPVVSAVPEPPIGALAGIACVVATAARRRRI